MAHARTEQLFLFIIIELIIALNFRSMRYSVFKLPPHMWLVISIISQLILTAVLIQIPSIRDAFGIIKPSASDLEIIIGFGVVVFISMEVVKAVLRRKMAARGRMSV
jgi:Ca2+-transporting ATPase